MNAPHPPIIWSIAGQDSAGGAGLSADQRAADAMGVHLCPVVAALTAQHSHGVQGVFPVPGAQLQAQLRTLADDLPPKAIKTGLLSSVQAIEAVAHWVDHWRANTPPGTDPHRHLALIVDPVLGASSGGAAFSNDSIVAAYRTVLLPRATVITPNRAEAHRLLGLSDWQNCADHDLPALAQALHQLGARSVVITGGDADSHHDHCLDWLQTPHAHGWLTAPRVDSTHNHGTGCTFATGVAAAWALGHVEADAIILANMLTRHALLHAHAAGSGPGPVMASAGFAAGPAQGGVNLPYLGLGAQLPWLLTQPQALGHAVHTPIFQPFKPPADQLYGILANSNEIDQALQAGLRCVQLRHKAREGVEAHLSHAMALAAQHGAQFFVNDHWHLALAAPEPGLSQAGWQLGLHLGQEDLLALDDTDKQALLAARQRVMLGLSSHSLWELARAIGCGASLIACGPVQATTTKDMPWLPQGLDNLAWWVAHSHVPVVAIGGLLTPDDLRRFASCRPATMCVVRGLGHTASSMRQVVSRLRLALTEATQHQPHTAPSLPHPVLPN